MNRKEALKLIALSAIGLCCKKNNMPNPNINRRTVLSSSFPSFSQEATAIISALSSTTYSQKTAINNYVLSLISAGVWTKIKALYGLVGTTYADQKINFVSPGTFDFTEQAGGTFTYNSQGVVLNGGANSYLHTGINCLTNLGSNASLISAQRSIIGGVAGGPIFGATSGTRLCLYTPYGADLLTCNVNKVISSAIGTYKNATAANLRIGSAENRMYINTTNLASDLTGISGSLPNTELIIGKDVSTAFNGGTNPVNLLCVATGLTVQNYLDFKTATDTFLYAYDKFRDYYVYLGDSNTEQPANPTTRFAYTTSEAKNKWEINNGKSGWSLQYVVNTTNSGYYNRATWIPIKQPQDKYIILMWGTNDIGYNCAYAGYTAANFNTQYRLYIDYILTQGWSASEIVLMTPPFQTQAARNTFWGANVNNIQQSDVDVYLNHCSQIAIDYGTKYVELYNSMAADYLTYLGSDGVHLTTAGNVFVKDQLLLIL